MADIKIELIKTAMLASVFLILLFPYLIHRFPGILNVDYVALGLGGSMIPTIRDGDLVAINGVWLSDLKVGDLLAVRLGRLGIVHRLVEIIEGETPRFRLKGDNNEFPDNFLFDESQLMGKVVTIYPLRGLYTLSSGYFISLTAAALLAVSLWRRPDIALNDVLLCLILSLSLAEIVVHMLRGVT